MPKKKDTGIRTILPNAITRRDVLHGMGAGLVSATLPQGLLGAEGVYAPEKEPGYYPPTRHGLRGSHPGSYEAAHAGSWQGRKVWNRPQQLDETYDLVVVGGGISGLAAAYFYRSEMPKARILILENHDDFGGHAQRAGDRCGDVHPDLSEDVGVDLSLGVDQHAGLPVVMNVLSEDGLPRSPFDLLDALTHLVCSKKVPDSAVVGRNAFVKSD